MKIEADGDLHIALQDVTGDKPGAVVVEIPAKPQWCDLRKIVFGWTEVQFPFLRVRSGRKFKFREPLIITVVGKAFFDVGRVCHRLRRSRSTTALARRKGLSVQPLHVIAHAVFERKPRLVSERFARAGEIGLREVLIMDMRIFNVIRFQISA